MKWKSHLKFSKLKDFQKPPKVTGDQIFDRLDPSILNKHLQNYMPGLTAKVFRTFNATHTMQQQLDLIPNKGTVAEKLSPITQLIGKLLFCVTIKSNWQNP